MENLKFKKLTEFELSQIRGGEWIKVDGKWIWVEDQAIDDLSEDQISGMSESMR